jgi:hypothetical protein
LPRNSIDSWLSAKMLLLENIILLLRLYPWEET